MCVDYNYRVCKNIQGYTVIMVYVGEDWQKKFEVSVTKRNQLESALINEKEKASQLSTEIKRFKVIIIYHSLLSYTFFSFRHYKKMSWQMLKDYRDDVKISPRDSLTMRNKLSDLREPDHSSSLIQ